MPRSYRRWQQIIIGTPGQAITNTPKQPDDPRYGYDCTWCKHLLTKHKINEHGMVLACTEVDLRYGGELPRQDPCHCGPYMLDPDRRKEVIDFEAQHSS